jgi:RHS repeat-associated protein
VDFGYTYDNNGNIASQTYHHRNQQTPPANGFTYDDLNRLITADYQAGTAGTEEFNYDLLGNRDSTTDSRTGGVNYTYASNNVNEYTDITPGTYDPDYDNAGNLIQDKSGYKYIYDYENRLTQITRQDNTVIATFEYDALGRRIEKKDMLTGIAKRYYYDDQRIALQTSVSAGGTETDYRYFIYGNYIDEVLVMHRMSPSADYYYAHDHLYSPVGLYSQSGVLVEAYEYDVYGSVRIFGAGADGVFFTADDQLRSASFALLANPYTFTGRELDSFDNNTLKLMYYRARSYDPQTGRFLQRDPLQYVDGMSLYEYVKNCPVNYNDPSGSLIDNPWNAFLSYIFGKGQAERLGDGFFSHFKGSNSYKEMIENLLENGQRKAECDNIVTYEISEDYSGVVTADLNWNYDPVLNFAIGTITKVSITGDCSVSCGKIQRIKEGCCCRCVMRCKAHFNLFNNYNWNGDNNVIFRLLGMHLVGTTYDMTGDFDESIRRSLVKCHYSYAILAICIV